MTEAEIAQERDRIEREHLSRYPHHAEEMKAWRKQLKREEREEKERAQTEKLHFVVDCLYEGLRAAEERAQFSAARDEVIARFVDESGESIGALGEQELVAKFNEWLDTKLAERESTHAEPSQDGEIAPQEEKPAPIPNFEMHFTRGKDGRISGPVRLQGDDGTALELSFGRDKAGRISAPVTIRPVAP